MEKALGEGFPGLSAIIYGVHYGGWEVQTRVRPAVNDFVTQPDSRDPLFGDNAPISDSYTKPLVICGMSKISSMVIGVTTRSSGGVALPPPAPFINKGISLNKLVCCLSQWNLFLPRWRKRDSKRFQMWRRSRKILNF